MAMMISKFNKIIHNKTVWLVFAIFISIAFVGVYTGSKSGSAAQSAGISQVAGMLWEEEVTRQEFAQAYQSVYVMYSMMTGQPLNINDEVDAVLRDAAWQRLATLKKAEQMGLTVTPDQVVNMIKNDRIFQNPQTGQYDPNAYKQFVSGFLAQTGMSSKGFENMMAQQVLIQKASAAAAQGALVTEDEIKQEFHLYNDLLTVDYAVLPRSIIGTTEVTEADAKAYYEQNPDQFMMPEKAVVQYVEFDAAAYTNTVEITDEIIAQIYEGNKQRFMIPETATNAVPEYRPLEEVKGEIFDLVSADMALSAATDAAYALVGALSEEGATFEGTAAAAGLTIVSNAPAFAATDFVRGIDPSAPFARTAFSLELSPTQYYSDPVIGREKVYVIALKKLLPAFLPNFDVVSAEAMESARMAAAEKAYVEKAEAIHAEIEAALAAGTPFADAVSKYNLEVVQTTPFSISSPLEGDFSRAIMSATVQFDAGALVDLISTPDEFLMAYIAEKQVADETETLPGVRDELAAGIRQQKASRLAQAWQESLLVEAGFEDLMVQTETTSDDEEEVL